MTTLPVEAARLIIVEWCHQNTKPVALRNCVVVEISHDIGVALGHSTIAGAAQAGHGLDGVARTEFCGGVFSFLVALGVVDHQNFIRFGI